jgi:hypothetical protein
MVGMAVVDTTNSGYISAGATVIGVLGSTITISGTVNSSMAGDTVVFFPGALLNAVGMLIADTTTPSNIAIGLTTPGVVIGVSGNTITTNATVSSGMTTGDAISFYPNVSPGTGTAPAAGAASLTIAPGQSTRVRSDGVNYGTA